MTKTTYIAIDGIDQEELSDEQAKEISLGIARHIGENLTGTLVSGSPSAVAVVTDFLHEEAVQEDPRVEAAAAELEDQISSYEADFAYDFEDIYGFVKAVSGGEE